MFLEAETPQAVIIDSGSTNRRGMTINVDESGNATVQQRGLGPQSIQLSEQLSKQLMRDIKAAGALSALPPRRCMKSVSFGSSLHVEFNGDRSPDLSCSPQSDPRAAALQKDANDVLQAVRQKLGVGLAGPVRPVRPAKPQ
jgi:hypothetical protein